LKFAIKLQAVYLRGTTYLRTPLFGIIPVVTLFVVCAGAVIIAWLAGSVASALNDLCQCSSSSSVVRWTQVVDLCVQSIV